MKRNKDSKYYSHLRKDLIDLVKGEGNKILDIGCGEGANGAELKRIGKAREVVGVEIFEPAALKAKERLDQVIVGDIQVIPLPFPDGYFDYIVLGDVLEHLYDPWKTLNQLKGYLSSSGFIIASIPNISYWEILKDLILFNRWEYQDEGVLDKAHIRFFTKRSMVEMMNKAGFEVESIVARRSPGIKAKLFNLFTLGIFRKFFESAYIIKGRKMRAC